MVRDCGPGALEGLLRLYGQLHGQAPAEMTAGPQELWRSILDDRRCHIIVCDEDGTIASTCTLIFVPNLTHGGRPYGIAETVVTDAGRRGRGLATACLARARELAEREGCCKLMLMTGSKLESTLRFYEKAGYSRFDKTGFVLWL
jgi:GNAT superfamily N-acetyltransferase